MDAKEKLMQMIRESSGCLSFYAERIADKLLAAGVIVPPFPIGTEYYRIVARQGKFAGV